MKAGTPTESKQTFFDEEERDRIRRALLRYMQDNRIGVPTLQRAIAESHGIVVDRIPQKSLQRFLGNTHRSNDMLVRFCRDFVAGKTDDDSLDLFGAQLAAFHATPVRDRDESPPPLLTLEECAGSFESTGSVRPKGLALLNPGNGDEKTKVSDLTLTAHAASPFLRATESVPNWRYESVPQGGARRAYDGVAVITAAGLMVSLRNVLTGTPRTWWLTAGPEGLAGPGAEPTTPLDPEPSTGLDKLGYQYLTFRRAEGGRDG